jgi:methylenetetrahydrofolate dehydrogenase (NADP+)/methenyltetrahydrofolate cyclohydrolase
MSAQLMKGLAPAQIIRREIAAQVEKLALLGVIPRLQVLLAGSDPASLIYAASKSKLGDSLGIQVRLNQVQEESQAARLLELWKHDPQVHGILVELPLPPAWDKSALLAALDPCKDVDGVNPLNRGYLLDGQEDKALLPATPVACIALLNYYHISLRGKNTVLLGRGDTVGRPLAGMLVRRDATVTICHRQTADLAWHCRQADVLISTTGKAGLITPDMVKPGAVVLDAGISQGAPGQPVCGDVAAAAAEVAAYLSPVPGGVGALTSTILLRNLLLALRRQGYADIAFSALAGEGFNPD